MPLVQILQVKYVPGSTLFHLWEVVQIFQRESIFCRKISSGGSLFIKKLVPGGTNLGGSIFTMTRVSLASQTHFRKRGKGLVNCVYKPCPTGMQLAG